MKNARKKEARSKRKSKKQTRKKERTLASYIEYNMTKKDIKKARKEERNCLGFANVVLGPLLLALMNCNEISQTICMWMSRVNGVVMKVKKGDGGKKERREGNVDGGEI